MTRHDAVSTGFLKPKGLVRALDGVSFTLVAGGTLAVVGESGCGKSTLVRQLTMIEPATSDGAAAREFGGQVLSGELPSPLNPPSGCAFHKRCPPVVERCRVELSALEELRACRHVACDRVHKIG